MLVIAIAGHDFRLNFPFTIAPYSCLTAPALAIDLPDKVPVQNSTANELSTGAPDLEQNRLGLRTDDRDFFQIDDQLLVLR